MRKKKRWKKAGAALLTLSLLTGNVQGLLTQAEECPAIVLEEQITEQCESDQDETEQILTETETKPETEKQSESQTEPETEKQSEAGRENRETDLTETES